MCILPQRSTVDVLLQGRGRCFGSLQLFSKLFLLLKWSCNVSHDKILQRDWTTCDYKDHSSNNLPSTPFSIYSTDKDLTAFPK